MVKKRKEEIEEKGREMWGNVKVQLKKNKREEKVKKTKENEKDETDRKNEGNVKRNEWVAGRRKEKNMKTEEQENTVKD